jgi:hypothetical protein
MISEYAKGRFKERGVEVDSDGYIRCEHCGKRVLLGFDSPNGCYWASCPCGCEMDCEVGEPDPFMRDES